MPTTFILYRGVGSNQIIGGQLVNRKSTTDNHAIFYTSSPPRQLPTQPNQLLRPCYVNKVIIKFMQVIRCIDIVCVLCTVIVLPLFKV